MGATKIEGMLWVGDWEDAVNASSDYIKVNVAHELTDIGDFRFPLLDDCAESNEGIFKKAVDKVDELIRGGKKVIVFCASGQSRSVAVAMGYLVRHGMTSEDALKLIQKSRPSANPIQALLVLVDDIG